jgi:hypothetical protein
MREQAGNEKDALNASPHSRDRRGEGLQRVLAAYRNLRKTIEGWTRANPGRVVVAVLVAVVAPLPVWWFFFSSGLFDEPNLQTVQLSVPTPAYPDEYNDFQLALNNAGKAAAEECSVRAYDYDSSSSEEESEDSEDPSVLGESEPFDLAPQEGYVATVSVYLSSDGGEPMRGGVRVRSLEFFTECANTSSYPLDVSIGHPESAP